MCVCTVTLRGAGDRALRQDANTEKKFLYLYIYIYRKNLGWNCVDHAMWILLYTQTLDVNMCMHYICILNVPYTCVVYAIHVYKSTIYIYMYIQYKRIYGKNSVQRYRVVPNTCIHNNMYCILYYICVCVCIMYIGWSI